MKHFASIQKQCAISLITVLVTLGASSLSQACFVATPEQTAPWQELVRRANTVVLVEAVSPSASNNTAASATGSAATPATKAKFQVLAVLKGAANPTIEMDDVIALPKPDPKNADKPFDAQAASFNDHHDKQFWRNGAGRTTPGPDCQIRPSFVVGQKYLVFQDKPYHVKSFEMIRTENDEWLAKVKAEIKKSGKNRVQ
jgi:hypothetical protein